MRHLVCIISTPVDILDTPGVVARLEQFIQEKRFHQVATANADFIINAMGDSELRQILREADLVTPDGMPLVWASRVLGSPLPERVTGADLVPALAALAAQKGYRIYMLGARPEVAQAARAQLLSNYPTLQIVGCVSPPLQPLDKMDNGALLRDIVCARPDILLVAFGNPKQEKWIYRNREALRDVPVCIGVGGTFDFIAGQTARAPQWMRRSGLEWVYRLCQEPKRLWKRYARDLTLFGRSFGTQWRVSRTKSGGATTAWTESRQGDAILLGVVGPLNAGQQEEFKARVERILKLPMHLVLDLTRATFIDAATVGTLLNLPPRAAYVERRVYLVGANARIRKTLRAARAEEALPLANTVAEALQSLSAARLPEEYDTHEGERSRSLEPLYTGSPHKNLTQDGLSPIDLTHEGNAPGTIETRVGNKMPVSVIEGNTSNGAGR